MLPGQDYRNGIMRSPIKVVALVILVIINLFLIRHGMRAAEKQVYENEALQNALELNRAALDHYGDNSDIYTEWGFLDTPPVGGGVFDTR
ncbi:MAG: hypothetical protein ACI83D_000258 [Planctomycetota bacterium]|jgi:hypothetical protein